ncbi:hypothetical protein Taro_020586 [Colocasia esculenta]|uniref:Amino acid transporter transmembrane domain-containing protein n=1 Tax=Colocasia esculenta TaxID=4460 RepID=A0A843V2H5_COLES|nr:hypothetical protein [Colocasia esculenta]
MYGSNVKSQITLDLPNRLFSSKLAIYTILINPLTKYALLITQIALAIEDQFVACESKLSSLIVRTLLVLSTMIAALTVPFFGCLMALCGSFLSTMASVLLPCICYLKIFKDVRKRGAEFLAIIMIILIGTLVDIAGTYSSLKQIMSSSNRAPQRDGKAPASPVPPSPPAPPLRQSTFSADYWDGFYVDWKMALQKASRYYGDRGLNNILPDIGPRVEHIPSSPSSPDRSGTSPSSSDRSGTSPSSHPSPDRSASSPPYSTEWSVE